MILATLETIFKDNHQDLVSGLGEVNQGLGDTSSKSDSAVASLTAIAGTAAAIGAVVVVVDKLATAAYDAAKASVEAALKINETEQSYEAFTSTAEEAAGLMQQIRDIAEKTDFKDDELLAAGGRMMQLGTASEDVAAKVQTIANAIDAVNGTAAQMNEVVEIFGKMEQTGQATGKMMQQLQKSGVDAFGILEDKLGLTRDEIVKLQDQGISTAEIWETLMEGMAEKTNTGVESTTSTFNRELKNLHDNINELYQSIGKEIIPVLEPPVKWINENFGIITTVIKGAFRELEDFLNKAKEVGNWFVEHADLIPGGQYIKAAAALSELGSKLSDIKNQLSTPAPSTGGGTGGGGSHGLMGPPVPPGYGQPEVPATLQDLEKDYEDLDKTVKKTTEHHEAAAQAAKAVAVNFDNLDLQQMAELASSIKLGMATEDIAANLDLNSAQVEELTKAQAEYKKGQDALDGAAFTVETQFKSISEAIDALKTSFHMADGTIDALFPKLKGAGELYDQMFKQAFQLFQGAFGPGVLAAYHSLIAQNESDLRLLQFMEATGQGFQTLSGQVDKLTSTMPSMDTAVDDLMKSFEHHAQVTNNVADAMQTVADVQLQSVTVGIGEAAGGAAAVGTGLAQLGEGLAQYGQMAATGTLPGGLPGGVPSFSGAGTPIMYGSGPPRGPVSGAGITNPFGGTDWSGSYTHGWPPIQVQLVGDDAGWARYLRVQQATWQSQNSRGVR